MIFYWFIHIFINWLYANFYTVLIQVVLNFLSFSNKFIQITNFLQKQFFIVLYKYNCLWQTFSNIINPLTQNPVNFFSPNNYVQKIHKIVCLTEFRLEFPKIAFPKIKINITVSKSHKVSPIIIFFPIFLRPRHVCLQSALQKLSQLSFFLFWLSISVYLERRDF